MRCNKSFLTRILLSLNVDRNCLCTHRFNGSINYINLTDEVALSKIMYSERCAITTASASTMPQQQQ